jgi:hypothetical protein
MFLPWKLFILRLLSLHLSQIPSLLHEEEAEEAAGARPFLQICTEGNL